MFWHQWHQPWIGHTQKLVEVTGLTCLCREPVDTVERFVAPPCPPRIVYPVRVLKQMNLRFNKTGLDNQAHFPLVAYSDGNWLLWPWIEGINIYTSIVTFELTVNGIKVNRYFWNLCKLNSVYMISYAHYHIAKIKWPMTIAISKRYHRL